MVAKVRPALIINIPFGDTERAVYAVVPHTTALRGGRFEVVVSVPWLQPGAFDVQGIRHVPASVFVRRLGVLNSAQIAPVVGAIKIWFQIP
jgi:mRNA interferase MazF